MRTCRLDFVRHRYDCEAGIVGEHNATQLIITPPYIMPETAKYRLCCEPGGLSELLQRNDNGEILYPLPRALTANGNCTVTLIGYVGNEQVYKSRMVCLHFSSSADDGEMSIDPQETGIAAEVTANTLARHTHTNKTVLDKLGEGGGGLTYDGKPIGGGTSTNELIVNVNLTDTDSLNPTVTADKTHEELSAAYETGAKLSVRVDFDGEATAVIPFLYLTDNTYCFAASLNPGTAVVLYCTADGWTYDNPCIDASDIVYGDTTLSLELNRLDSEVNANAKDRHTHSNKAVLDSLSAAGGKLKYNGSDVGLKGDKGDTGAKGTDGKTPVKGVDYWTAADQESIVNDVLAALPDGDEVSY